MSKKISKYLFTPGPGAVPPYLAGRKQEQEYYRDCVEALKDKEPLSQDMIVYGPRGNGKTALLRHLDQETHQKEWSTLDILWAKPFELETEAGLENLAKGKDRKSSGKVKKVELRGNLGLVGGSVEMDYSGPGATLMNLLRSKSQNKPLILIVDEAHTLKPEVGKVLLNISQDLHSERRPFLLVLAGTPNLRIALGRANATFWDRSMTYSLGRLSPGEARQAITVPLEKVGVSFDTGVARQIVDRTYCYPYFTQVWGNCFTKRLHQTGARVISMETVKEVEGEAIKKCATMYQERRNEIITMGLLPVAESVAHAFIESGEQYLHEGILLEAIERGIAGDELITSERIWEKFHQLSHLGYVWQVYSTEGHDYEPGIPSLMTYVNGRAKTHQATLAKKSRLTDIDMIDMDFGV